MGERTFIDEATLTVVAGSGGDGAASFLREKFKPKGRPDGANGGRGGSVILRVDPQIATLRELARRNLVRAGDGGNGSGRDKTGADADDVIVHVPEGTEVRTESGELLADLVGAGSEFVVAQGGRGGRGNVAFQNVRRRHPSFAERGERGESRTVRMTLKVLADVGLVGFPNAGKSSLLRSVTAATPEVAAYPFTTLSPQLGVAEAAGRIVLADVPGLIEGAASGKGLGHAFLRHLERCSVLCVVLDAADQIQSAPEALVTLLEELEAYSPVLAEKARIVAVNKIDIADPHVVAATIESAAPRESFAISAETGEGVEALAVRLAELVKIAKGSEVPKSHRTIRLRPGSAKVSISRDEDVWVVSCDIAERLVRRFDLSNPDALAYLQDRFDQLGIEAALSEAGARPGDDVALGDLMFTYEPDQVDHPTPAWTEELDDEEEEA